MQTNPDDVLSSFRLWQSASQKADAYRQSIDVQPKAAKAARELADTVRQSGAEDIEPAKDGLNGFGQFVVDTSVFGSQVAGDAALGTLVGTNANLPMVIRTFGEAAQETRQDGLNLDQQLLNGLGSAGISYLIGKLPGVSNLLQKFLGQNEVNKFTEELVKEYGATAAAQIIQRIALPALRDGGEALLADALQAGLKKAIYGPDTQLDWMNAWYDFLAATVLGGFGKFARSLGDAAN